MTGKRPSASQIRTAVLTQPDQANFHGNVHGGNIMKWLDEAGGMAAMRHSGQLAVTVFLDSMTFEHPVSVGDILHFTATPTWVGRTSMEILIEVEKENPFTGQRVVTNKAYAVYVAVDGKGNTVKVPGLLLQTAAEQAHFDAAEARRAYRLSLRHKLDDSQQNESSD